MNQRLVTRVVAILTALFITAAALFTLAVTRGEDFPAIPAATPHNPHADLEQTERCLECHTVADQTIPVTHRLYAEHTCALCHQRAPRVLVPHSVAMGTARCLLCHGDPARDHGIPEGHLAYETRECLLCHPVDPDKHDEDPLPAGVSRAYAQPIPHPLTGFFEDCTYCHQIGERASLPANHRHFEIATCTECHEPAYTPVATKAREPGKPPLP